MKVLQIVLISLTAFIALPSAAQTTSDMQILADKVRADKKLVVAANMQLTDAEAKAFWPVYDAYQVDLQKINQRLGTLITDYASEYNKGALSDQTAKRLMNELLALEEAEVKLKRTYVPRLEKALPGAKVARYLQVENKIRAVLKYELAANIPLVQ